MCFWGEICKNSIQTTLTTPPFPFGETLAKYAQALDIPLYQIFYDGEAAPKKIKGLDLDGAKLSNGERREIESLGRQFAKLKARDKGLVRLLVAKLAQAAS